MKDFLKSLEQTAGDLRQQAKDLAADSRQDDADLTKIRDNIYEICATVGGVVCKTQPESRWEAVYRSKLAALPQSWRAALEAARAHGDDRRAAVEELKLEALADVLARIDARKEA